MELSLIYVWSSQVFDFLGEPEWKDAYGLDVCWTLTMPLAPVSMKYLFDTCSVVLGVRPR